MAKSGYNLSCGFYWVILIFRVLKVFQVFVVFCISRKISYQAALGAIYIYT